MEAPKEDEQTVYQVVEEMPEFPGGMPALMEFIRKNLRHDKAEKNERVIIQIVVDKKGNATNLWCCGVQIRRWMKKPCASSV